MGIEDCLGPLKMLNLYIKYHIYNGPNKQNIRAHFSIAYLRFCATLFCTPRNVSLDLYGTVHDQICRRFWSWAF